MDTNNYSLQPGAVLQNEYHILGITGRGGFSIVYLAESNTDAKKVIVKELFNSDYMERSVSERTVCLKDPDSASLFEEDKKRFFAEWNLMQELKACAGSINPIDYFEENDTAYIVMEYLPGGSLGDNVSANGGYDPDSLLKKLDHVIELLTEMHRRRYLHRDISPDNLVMDSDGNYKLIDFGAALGFGDSGKSENVLRKKGYTPLEAYNPDSEGNPKSDIYSLCAVLYFALTGIEPTDSLDRYIGEELRTLSEVLPKCDPLIEQMIMKGLSLYPDDRWNSMDDIRKVITLFGITENERRKEEEKDRRQRRIKKIGISGIIAAAVVIFVFVFCRMNRELVKFRGAKTQKIVLYYDEDMERDKVDLLRNNTKQKLDHIAGSEYILDQSDGSIVITTAYELFHGTDIPNTINRFFNYDRCYIGTYSDEGFQRAAELTFDQIDSLTEQDEGIVLELSQSLLEKIENNTTADSQYALKLETFDNGGNRIWDKENTPFEGDSFIIGIKFDFEHAQVFISDQEVGGEIARKLFADCLSQMNVPIDSFNYSRSIIWETRKENTWGKNQVTESGLQGKTVLLVYKDEKQAYTGDPNIFNYNVGKDNVESDSAIVPLKRRLDSLSIPYACGWDAADESEVYIEVGAEDIWEIEAVALLDSFSNDELRRVADSGCMEIKTSTGIVFADVDTEAGFGFDKGKVRVKVSDILIDGEVMDQALSVPLQLCLFDRPILQAPSSEMLDNGWITFNTVLLDNIDNDRDLERFVSFVNACLENKYITTGHVFEGAIFVDDQGKQEWDKTIWDLPGCETTAFRNEVYEYFSGKGMEVKSNSGSPAEFSVCCTFDDEKEKSYEHPFAIVEEFLQTIPLTNEVKKIHFTISSTSRTRPIGMTYGMTIEQNDLTGRTEAGWFVELWDSTEETADSADIHNVIRSLREEARQYLASKETFRSCFLNPSLDVKYEKTVVDTDELLLNVLVMETQPGQDFQFKIYIENRTYDELDVSLENLCINGVMTDYEVSMSVEPLSDGAVFYYSIDGKKLHFSTMNSFRNAIMEFLISNGEKEVSADVVINENSLSVPNRESLNIPQNAELIEDTNAYSIYCIGTERKDMLSGSIIDLVFFNKTTERMTFDIERMDYEVRSELYENDFFTPDSIIVLPKSAAYYSAVYYEYYSLWQGSIDAVILNIKTSSTNGLESVSLLSDKGYRFLK